MFRPTTFASFSRSRGGAGSSARRSSSTMETRGLPAADRQGALRFEACNPARAVGDDRSPRAGRCVRRAGSAGHGIAPVGDRLRARGRRDVQRRPGRVLPPQRATSGREGLPARGTGRADPSSQRADHGRAYCDADERVRWALLSSLGRTAARTSRSRLRGAAGRIRRHRSRALTASCRRRRRAGPSPSSAVACALSRLASSERRVAACRASERRADLPSGTVTFSVTDVEGSTKLVEE